MCGGIDRGDMGGGSPAVADDRNVECLFHKQDGIVDQNDTSRGASAPRQCCTIPAMSFDLSRREFLEIATAAGVLPSRRDARPHARLGLQASEAAQPWFRRTFRWMQTNIAEIDVTRYDIRWWREHWKRTHTQGIVVNAGGIVAYYPTDVPLASARGVSRRPRSVRRAR